MGGFMILAVILTSNLQICYTKSMNTAKQEGSRRAAHLMGEALCHVATFGGEWANTTLQIKARNLAMGPQSSPTMFDCASYPAETCQSQVPADALEPARSGEREALDYRLTLH